jgi:preprotein translocase subunit SecG
MITLQSSQVAHIIFNVIFVTWLAFLLTVTYYDFSAIYRIKILLNFGYYVLPVLNLIFSLVLVILIILQRGDQGAFQGTIAKNNIDSATMNQQTIKISIFWFFHLFINNQMIIRHAHMIIS